MWLSPYFVRMINTVG